MTKGMLNIRLRNAWFDGTQLREPGVQEVPEGFENILPTSAEILDEDGEIDEAAMKRKRDREAGVAEDTKEAAAGAATSDKTVQVPLKK